MTSPEYGRILDFLTFHFLTPFNKASRVHKAILQKNSRYTLFLRLIGLEDRDDMLIGYASLRYQPRRNRSSTDMNVLPERIKATRSPFVTHHEPRR